MLSGVSPVSVQPAQTCSRMAAAVAGCLAPLPNCNQHGGHCADRLYGPCQLLERLNGAPPFAKAHLSVFLASYWPLAHNKQIYRCVYGAREALVNWVMA